MSMVSGSVKEEIEAIYECRDECRHVAPVGAMWIRQGSDGAMWRQLAPCGARVYIDYSGSIDDE